MGPPSSPAKTSMTIRCCSMRLFPAKAGETTTAWKWSPSARPSHLGLGAGHGGLDALLELVGGGHLGHSLERRARPLYFVKR